MTMLQSAIGNPESAIADSVVSIGDQNIGANLPVYIIAEAGVNHNGDVAAARKLIDAAYHAGADAVKFQVFSADRLVSASAPTCDYQQRHDGHATTQRDMLRRLELKPAAFRDLKTHADRCGIDFLATPFAPEELTFLVDLDVPAVKLASSDVVNGPLLAAAAKTSLPVILSTGASELAEIDAAVRLIQSESRKSKPESCNRLILLHCVSAYPTQPCDAGLACIRTLEQHFNVPTGFSDHTPDSTFSSLAVAAGAAVLEKHLTLDRNASGPDHFFSLEPAAFSEYVAAARHAQATLGDGAIRVTPEESEVRELARGSLVTTTAIAAGKSITAAHLTIQRPGDGIGPMRWDDVIGRVVKTDIPPNTRLSWSMLRKDEDEDSRIEGVEGLWVAAGGAHSCP